MGDISISHIVHHFEFLRHIHHEVFAVVVFKFCFKIIYNKLYKKLQTMDYFKDNSKIYNQEKNLGQLYTK